MSARAVSNPDVAAMGKPLSLPNLKGARPPREQSAANPEPAPTQAPVDDAPWKYTALLTTADRDRALDLEAAVVRRARIRRSKGMRAEVLRAFLAVAQDDPDLQQRLADHVAAQLHDGPTA